MATREMESGEAWEVNYYDPHFLDGAWRRLWIPREPPILGEKHTVAAERLSARVGALHPETRGLVTVVR